MRLTEQLRLQNGGQMPHQLGADNVDEAVAAVTAGTDVGQVVGHLDGALAVTGRVPAAAATRRVRRRQSRQRVATDRLQIGNRHFQDVRLFHLRVPRFLQRTKCGQELQKKSSNDCSGKCNDSTKIKFAIIYRLC